MKTSSFKKRNQKQFDNLCRRALIYENKYYRRTLLRRMKRETAFSDLSKKQSSKMGMLSTTDRYDTNYVFFSAMGFNIEIEEMLLAEAIINLKPKQQDIILLSFGLGMSDSAIAEKLHNARMTIYRNKKDALQQMKTYMEERNYEKEK